jgi:fucose permease
MDSRARNLFSRVACLHFFALEGILSGLWASQLPEIQRRDSLSDSTLGLCGLSFYLGTVAGTPISGFLIQKLGSKWATVAGALFFVLSLPLIGIELNLTYLISAMLLLGTGMGLTASHAACPVPSPHSLL